jgi:hypothetical protein
MSVSSLTLTSSIQGTTSKGVLGTRSFAKALGAFVEFEERHVNVPSAVVGKVIDISEVAAPRFILIQTDVAVRVQANAGDVMVLEPGLMYVIPGRTSAGAVTGLTFDGSASAPISGTDAADVAVVVLGDNSY